MTVTFRRNRKFQGRPTAHRRLLAGSAVTSALLAGVILAPSALAADPPLLFNKCPLGADASQCPNLKAVAVDPANGHLYVIEGGRRRISEITPWGEFVRAFGWNVAPDGAPGDTAADKLETCTAVCQAGAQGSGPGQFGLPGGIAVDSAGDVYVREFSGGSFPNNRVQKFDTGSAAVQFAWMVGDGVNQGPGNPGNLCSAADVTAGDTCGGGGIGTGPGEFGDITDPDDDLTVDTQGTATASDDRVYVGDVNRIQRLDVDGNVGPETPVPGETATVLDVAPGGDIYTAFDRPAGSTGERNESDIHRLSPTGTELDVLPVLDPSAVAVGSGGGVYVFDRAIFRGDGVPDNHPARVLHFDSSGDLTETLFDGAFGGDGSGSNPPVTVASTGIATSSACGIPGEDLYITSSGAQVDNGVRAYGPHPEDPSCPPPAAAPSIEEAFTSGVDTDSATVTARINPHFWADTRFYVEHGLSPCSAGGCVQTPTPPGQVLTDQVIDQGFSRSLELSGLAPATTYYYRVVSTSSGGGPTTGPDLSFHTLAGPDAPTTACPNQTFRNTTPSASLPDCRAFEMVSPVDKNGGDVWQGINVTVFGHVDKIDQATPTGDALTYSSYQAFAGATSGAFVSQYLADRDPEDGWQTKPLSPPESGPSFHIGFAQMQHFQAFTPDLCTAFYYQHTDNSLADGAVTGFPDLYRLRNCAEPGIAALTTVAPPGLPAGTNLYFPKVQGFSADGQAAFFRANGKLTNNASAQLADDGSPIFQVYVKSDSAFRLVSVLPSPGGSSPGPPAPTNSNVGTLQGRDLGYHHDLSRRAVSEDGSRVYWSTTNTTPSPGGNAQGGGAGQLYVRLNPTSSSSPVSGGQSTDPDRACTLPVSETIAPDPAFFETATPDGSKALFRFDGGAHNHELYVYDLASQSSGLIASGVHGVMGASDDLSSVYFASHSVLAPGATGGKVNLYLWREGQGVRFIATLPITDEFEPVGDASTGPSAPINQDPSFRPSRVTSNGNAAVFTSSGSLTGFDNTDAASGEPDTEVFRYDAVADQLQCISCSPTGARPLGHKVVSIGGWGDYWVAGHLPGWEYAHHPSRVVADDGSRIFFNSFEALDPRDTNAKQDVYQWEAEGSGDCDDQDANFYADRGGCLSLISSGSDANASEFVDASADGDDVFIRTRAQLHGSDTDQLLDIYDARVGGGFPAPPSTSPPCSGDACQGGQSSAPAAENPAPPESSGNVTPPGAPDCSHEQAAVRTAKKALKRAHGKQAKKKARKRLHKAKRRLMECKQGSGS